MKLLIQIPAFNEADSLPAVLDGLPRTLPGVDRVEWLVIDDGSTDDTAEVARQHGADHVVRHASNRGLAVAFQTGLDACLRLGADVIVNTDADNQYPGDQIPALIAPILAGQADLVVGDRQVSQLDHFSTEKKLLQGLGSWVVRLASATNVPDAPSGFRAYSREAALRLFVTSEFTYTVENLIQAGRRRLRVAHVPIRVNATYRGSKLHRGNWDFVKRQAATIVRTYATYEPLKTFFYLALPFALIGLVLYGRLVVLWLTGQFTRGSNVQSLIAGATALILAFLIFLIGLLADRIGDTRRLMEEILYRQRKAELDAAQSVKENNRPPQ
jgi:glycosyltransferase involved in cell wall biosynthesis